MTRLHHDEFAKGFLESLLSPFGQVQTSFKISAEVREVDVYYQHDPTIQPIPELGLLGTLAQTDLVLELSWLGNLKVILEARETREPEEEDLMMQLSPLFLEKIQAAEQQGEAIGEARGKVTEGQALILRQLSRRVGNVSVESEARIKGLPLAQLEELGEALLDFSQMADLIGWLDVVGVDYCSENRD